MSRTATGATYPTISTVGALLPSDLLTRLAAGDLEHLTPSTYGLPESFTLRQAAARAWELLLPTYRSFQTRLAALPDSDPATIVTRDRWTTVVLRELGYDLTAVPNIEVEDDTFDVRHLDGHVPVHMLGWNVDLDKRATTNIRGASRTAPHSLIQELLNRTDNHLWAILTNGKRLRLLRDNIVMGRPAYIEFDLEGMFTGEQFADFAILYALAHATRLRSEQPADCILEQWRTTAISDGARALNDLRLGFVDALVTLGSAFITHPQNAALRDLLTRSPGAVDDYYRWLLRLVYRLIFLFVAEDRGLLHDPESSPQAQQTYRDHFSSQRLRRLASRNRAGRHTDLWLGLGIVFRSLGSRGEPALGLPALGSQLFEEQFLGLLPECRVSNQALLRAVQSLSQLNDASAGVVRPVDYRNLGAEELGGVYEALLEFVPAISADGDTFELMVAAGNARKGLGAYYTPTELVDTLLTETLDPLVREAMGSNDPESALLSITVCDPACGSGHFLVAAARRIARALAIARTGDPEPTVEAVRDAMRDVVGRCIFGVDLNDMAAELAKIGLWLEAISPGKPLSFLDSHIKVGNALLGATPRLLAKNIPDSAFSNTTPESKRVTGMLRKRNKYERENLSHRDQHLDGGTALDIFVSNAGFGAAASAVDTASSDDIASLRAQADAWRRFQTDPNLERARLLADAWCSAFVWPLGANVGDDQGPPTHRTLATLQHNADLDPLARRRDMLTQLAREYRFFHWHLEFPQIFAVPPRGDAADDSVGWSGGFSCVVGNPPYLDSEALSSADPAQRHAIEGIWGSAAGNWDLFVPFVELANVLTRRGGRHAMVTPNKILGIPYVAALQQRLMQYRPFSVHDYSDVRVFRDASVNVVVLAVEKVPTHQQSLAHYVHQAQGPPTVDEVSLNGTRPPGFAFANVSEDGYMARLTARLGEYAACSDGATTGQAYEIREIIDSDSNPDPTVHARLANTGTIDPFVILWGTREVKYLGFKDLHPVVAIEDLRAIAPKRAEQARSPKVMLGGMGGMLEAVADADGHYLCGKSAVLVLPDEDVCPYAMAAFLNAPDVTRYYKALFGAQGFGTKSMNIGPKQIAQLPIVDRHHLRPSESGWTPATPAEAKESVGTEAVLSGVGRLLHANGFNEEWTPQALDEIVQAVAGATGSSTPDTSLHASKANACEALF